MRQRLHIAVVVLVVVLAGCGASSSGGGGGAQQAAGGQGGNIGLSAGGAQDANAFRTNVREGYVPRPRAITHAGLYHDYYFDTGQSEPCSALFCPSYTRAVSEDPLSGETEQFMTVGLNSGISQANFSRPDLNLVVVVDTSGSMRERFNQYYYEDGERREVESTESKMSAARSAVGTLTHNLREGDRIGVVSFSDQAETVTEMTPATDGNLESVRADIRSLRAQGGTDLEAGMDRARQMISNLESREGEETRVVYVTDAMPNQGETGVTGLQQRLETDASNGIHTTFVGVGLDFNTELTDAITDIRGGNYYAVHSPAQFSERMGEGFEYMVTPLVYDLSLRVDSEDFRIEHVYGTPSDGDTSRLMHVTTLFPSRREDNRTEGGVILLELARTGDGTGGSLDLTTSYETRQGETHEETRTVQFDGRDPPYYGNTGVRKAVTLTRYATLMQNWMDYQHAQANGESVERRNDGIEYREPGRWEWGSVQLQVTEPYGSRIEQFRDYFASEMAAIGDDSMQRDLEVLDRLRDRPTVSTTPVTEGRQQNFDPAPRNDGGGGLFGAVSIVDLLSLGATVVIGGYGLKKRNRGQ